MKRYKVFGLQHLHDLIATHGNSDKCLLWDRGLNGKYPCVYGDGKDHAGHRIALRAKLGRQLKPGFFACHTCDTPACINPNHLFEGSASDNSLDAKSKGRLVNNGKHGNHSFGDKNGARTHPERVPRGDRNGSHTRPDRRPRGDANGITTLQTRWLRANLMTLVKEKAAGLNRAILAKKYGVSERTVSNYLKQIRGSL